MTSQDRVLQILLRLVGTAGLLAIPFILVPNAWMDAIHRDLGLGPLPEEPIVGYLARSASAFYAILGGLLWAVSFDLRRHRLVLSYLGVAIVLFGLTMLAVDFGQGMPVWWSLAEGPFNIICGAAFAWLCWRMDKAGQWLPFRRDRPAGRGPRGRRVGDRDQTSTWIIFEFLGGPSDGKSVQGALGDGSDAERYYLFTNHGSVGHRFKVASEYAVETLAHEELHVDEPRHFQRHYYVVTERLQDGEEVWVRAVYQPCSAT